MESRPSSRSGFSRRDSSFPAALPVVAALPAPPSCTDRNELMLPLRLYPPLPSSKPSFPADNTPAATTFRSTIGASPLLVFLRMDVGGPINPPKEREPVVLRIERVDMSEALEFLRPPSRRGAVMTGGGGAGRTSGEAIVLGKGILSVAAWLRELGRTGGAAEVEGCRVDC